MSIANKLIAAGDYKDAIKKLGDIPKANSYKGTEYAAKALYLTARIDRFKLYASDTSDQDKQTDLANAIIAYSSLINDYPASATSVGHDVVGERLAVEKLVDEQNSGQFLYKLIDWFVNLTGAKSYSYWIALLLISVIVRVVLTPLTITQYKSMREMQRMQPLIKELQAKYKNQKDVLGQKTMELYKEHNVNPAASCLPMLLQLPVFWYMYHAVWLYQYHFSRGTFLWIGSSLSSRYPHVLATNLSESDLVLLFLYSVSMYVTQRMMPQADPVQAEQQKTTAMMTSVFFFIMFQQWHFASAFVLYWFISNVLSSATQMYFMRQGDQPTYKGATVLPSDGEISTDSGTPARNGKYAKPIAQAATASVNGASAARGAARGVISPKGGSRKKKR
jgi:YidC/Oxa1 family membrane protein insertase